MATKFDYNPPNAPWNMGGGSGSVNYSQDYYGTQMRDNSFLSTFGEALSGIPIIGNFLGSLFGYSDRENALLSSEREMYFNATEAEKNRYWQTEEREAAQDWAYKMWQDQNEYNSLTARLARAKKAGVSPNAVLGGEDYQAGNVGSPQFGSGSQASYSSSLAPSLLGQSAQLAKLRAESANLESDTDNKKYELSWNKATQDERARAWSLGNSKTSSEIKELLSRSNLNDVEAEVSRGTLQIMQNKSEAEIAVMLEQLNLLRNESLDLLSQIEFRNGSLQLIKAQTDNYVEQTELLKKENELKQIEVAFSNGCGLPVGTPEYMAVFRMWQTGQLSGYVAAKTAAGMNQLVNDAVDNVVPNVVVPFAPGSSDKPKSVKPKSKSKSNKPKGGFFRRMSLLSRRMLPVGLMFNGLTGDEGLYDFSDEFRDSFDPMKQRL